MSKAMPSIQVVCEGPTDFVVIQAAISNLMGTRDFRITQIQPETSLFAGNAGPHGGGWKGVRSWCRAMAEESGSLGASSALFFADILIIHVDADVADDREVNCARPCPPCCDTTNALRVAILEWGNEMKKPEKVVFCTPSRNSEAWVIAALYPNDKIVTSGGLECRQSPEAYLAGKPADEKIVRKNGRKYKKEEALYRSRQSTFMEKWAFVRSCCSEADRFSTEYLDAIV
jgi:hypothetical protein